MKRELIIENLASRKRFNSLYQFDPVKTSDSKVVAQWLCEGKNLERFKSGINKISRKRSYIVKHKIDKRSKTSSRREEERIAIFLAENHLHLNSLGIVLDYQIPLKDTNQDKGAGKIDLISYNAESNKLYLLELKRPSSTESLLRCCLEAYTYSRVVDGEKLKRDISSANWLNTKISADAEIVPCPLIFSGSKPAFEFQNATKELQTIISSLGITVALITYTAEIFNARFKLLETK